MLLLHPNLHHVTKIASDDAGRYATTSIHVVAEEGGYRVEATDLKRLIIVKGKNVADPADFPTTPALAAAPNTATEALVPAREFERAMKDAPKKTGRPILGSVACVMGSDCSTFATTDLESYLVRQPRNVEGRFPDCAAIMPKKPASVTVHVDAVALAELLKVMSEFTPGGDVARVSIEIRDGNTAIIIKAANGEQEATGVIMPLT